jgi:hypothetical protein
MVKSKLLKALDFAFVPTSFFRAMDKAEQDIENRFEGNMNLARSQSERVYSVVVYGELLRIAGYIALAQKSIEYFSK